MALTSTEEAQLRALIAQQSAILSLAGNETTITSKLGATKVNLGGISAVSSVSDTDITLVRQGTADKSSTFAVIKSWLSTASGFVLSNGSNGYVKFPAWLGSVIIQWGPIPAIPANSGLNINYSIAYPVRVFATTCTSGATGQAGPAYSGFDSAGTGDSKAGFKVWNSSATLATLGGNFLSIGI